MINKEEQIERLERLIGHTYERIVDEQGLDIEYYFEKIKPYQDTMFQLMMEDTTTACNTLKQIKHIVRHNEGVSTEVAEMIYKICDIALGIETKRKDNGNIDWDV
jgi:hypothetical protein